MNDPLKIMITGAGGFIGSRLSDYFRTPPQSENHSLLPLFILDIIRKRGRANVSGGKSVSEDSDNSSISHAAISLDLSDHAAVGQTIHDIRPDIVIHTAAVTSKLTQATEDDYTSQNLDNSVALLNALTKIQNDHYKPSLIFSSSVSVYGVPSGDDGLVSENDAPDPQSDYAQSKMDFENILRAQTDIRYAILRYSNIPGKDGFMNAVLKNKKAVFYGDESYVRDYIHLDDLCDLHGVVIDYLVKGGSSLTLNAGGGVGFSFQNLVNEIENQTGLPITHDQQPAKENDIVRLICDMQRAKDILDWQSQKTDIKDIVSYALENSEYYS